jgi:hypothetical protein
MHTSSSALIYADRMTSALAEIDSDIRSSTAIVDYSSLYYCIFWAACKAESLESDPKGKTCAFCVQSAGKKSGW